MVYGAAHDRTLGEERAGQKIEKLPRGIERIVHELLRLRAAELAEEPALGPRVIEILQRALDAVTGQREPKVGRGHLGHGVGLVQHEEIVGKQHAPGIGIGALGLCAAGADQGEEQGVVDDDEIGRAHAGAGALIEALLGVAVFARAGGGVGVDGVPYLGTRGRADIVPEARVGLLRPVGDALQFIVVSIGKERRAIRERVAEARRAEVVGFADEHSGLEVGVAGEGRRGLEELPALREIARFQLFLQRDGVGRDDELAGGIDGVDEPGDEIGQRLAHARAGFEEEGLVGLHGRGDGARHRLLLRAVAQIEPGMQPAVLGEDLRGEGGRVARRRRRGAGFFAKADHY